MRNTGATGPHDRASIALAATPEIAPTVGTSQVSNSGISSPVWKDEPHPIKRGPPGSGPRGRRRNDGDRGLVQRDLLFSHRTIRERSRKGTRGQERPRTSQRPSRNSGEGYRRVMITKIQATIRPTPLSRPSCATESRTRGYLPSYGNKTPKGGDHGPDRTNRRSSCLGHTSYGPRPPREAGWVRQGEVLDSWADGSRTFGYDM